VCHRRWRRLALPLAAGIPYRARPWALTRLPINTTIHRMQHSRRVGKCPKEISIFFMLSHHRVKNGGLIPLDKHSAAIPRLAAQTRTQAHTGAKTAQIKSNKKARWSMSNGNQREIDKMRGRHNDAPCIEDGCNKRGERRGMCRLHYTRWHKAQQPPCMMDGCVKLSVARGLCDKHYTEMRRRKAQTQTEVETAPPMHPALREFIYEFPRYKNGSNHSPPMWLLEYYWAHHGRSVRSFGGAIAAVHPC